MASGKLGSSAPAATTNTVVYTVPVGKIATFNVGIVNTTAVPLTFRLAISPTGVPGAADWLEYDAQIQPNDVYERSALVAGSAENVVVFAAAVGLSVRVYGIEQ